MKTRLGIFCFFLTILSVAQKSGIPLRQQQNELSVPELLWNDEFNDNTLNSEEWSYEIGATGWGDDDSQNDTKEKNVIVSEGTLKIVVKKEVNGEYLGAHTAVRMTTQRKFAYGRMEIRAKMPDYKGKGIWSSIWMLGNDIKDVGWPDCGEINIMEYLSKKPNQVVQTIHSVTNNHTEGAQISTDFIPLKTIEEDFHTYGIIWKEDKLQFYIDSPEHITLTIPKPENPSNDNWPFNKPYYLILKMEIGGHLGGEIEDKMYIAQMEIDYVRVYKN